MKTKVKKIAFILSLLVFVLPLIETQMGFFTFEALKGAYTRKAKPAFTDSTWFDGKFQLEYGEYLNDTVGFRPLLIRIFNQLDYSLFNKLHAWDIVVGKNNSLQATTHYDAYLGKLKIPTRSIDGISHKLKLLQDTLSKKNISLLFVFAPSKGSFSFCDAPYSYDTSRKDLSWYDKYIISFKRMGITYFDFNRYYLDKKGKIPYPLYTKYGIHWSFVSCPYAFDTLCKFIEYKQHVKLPSIIFNAPIETTEPNKTDVDLTSSLNLLYSIKFDEKFWNPSYTIRTDSLNNKVSAMFISDSYFWNFSALGLPDQIFNQWSFWYYYNTVYEKNINQSFSASSKDISAEIEKNNVIIIMATFTNLDNPGWGFIDKAYEHYFEEKDKKIKEITEQIKSNAQWFNSVKEKATTNHIDLDKQLYFDAIYVYGLRNKK